ncbi:hypothetical protein ACFW1A_14395 [Kitasatospora sp. NPDC058965]|uniref:TRAFAC clade GTPase domain-containing protein n=1 Tax=Kitasatospora sp. NPDC058965 TaxID=3346682 RepID=UPI0036A4669E
MFTTTDVPGQRAVGVIMIGPRGVGKTSLLTAIYDQFQRVVSPTGLVVRPEGRTATLLQTYREELRRFAHGLTYDPGIAGNKTINDHVLTIGTPRAPAPELRLNITDIAGEALTEADSHLRARFAQALAASAVVFVAIDTPALMEDGGVRHDEVNKSELITDVLREAVSHQPNLLVVLVPLKSEKYAQQPELLRQLHQRVRIAYQPLLDFLGSLQTARAAVVLTTAQTVGSMVYSRLDRETGEELFVLRALRQEYSPQDTDQPLRWMLRFVLNAYRDRPRGPLEWLRDALLGTNRAFAAAARTFTADCKEGVDGFAILLYHDYLGAL